MNTIEKTDDFSKSLFDRSKFHSHTKGCEQVRPAIISAFVTHTPTLLVELDQALSDNFAKRASKIVHKLKSSVALFCTDALYTEISEIERGAVHIETPEYLSAGRRLIMKIGKLVHELQQISANDYPVIENQP